MNRLNYILGAIIPIPLFFDLHSLSFFVQLLTPNSSNAIPIDYFAGSYESIGFAPVPIGIVAFALVAILSIFPIKYKIHAISVKGITLSFFLIIFIALTIPNIGMVKTLMLLFPFLCMCFAVGLTKNIEAYKKIGSGYIASIVLIVLLHFLSTLYFNINDITGHFFLFNSIFGMQIYQASVAYSAVLSYVAVTLIIFTGYKRNISPKVIFFIIIIWFLLSLGARKAVILDIGILFLLFLFSAYIRFIYTLKIKKNIMMLFLLFIPGYIALTFSNFSSRNLSIDYAVSQRGDTYKLFYDLMASADLTNTLLGHGGSWGGFSNFFIEMIYRLGLLGFVLYFTALFIGLVIVKKHFKYLFNFNSNDGYFLIWLWFTVLTVLLSNLFNMNLQLPYYSMNVTLIMMIFLYRTKTFST